MRTTRAAQWVLVAGDGRQVSPAPNAVNMSPGMVQPGDTAGRIAAFEQVGLGGTLRFVAFADDFVTASTFRCQRDRRRALCCPGTPRAVCRASRLRRRCQRERVVVTPR